MTCVSSLKRADRKSGTVIEFCSYDKRRILFAKNSQLKMENTLDTAFHAALIPVEYASPGRPTVIKPLDSDAFSLMDRTHGPRFLPPRKYSEEPLLLNLADHIPRPNRNTRYKITIISIPVPPID